MKTMNVIYDLADIRISEVHTERVCVPRWEIPVLQVIHGDDCQVVGQQIIERAVPNPGDEFTRLAARYGPKNEEVPAVAAIYGNYGPGTQALRREIRDSLTSAGATPSDYKSPAERKLTAEKAADAGGQSIVEEAIAREKADAVAQEVLNAAEKAGIPETGASEIGTPDLPDSAPSDLPEIPEAVGIVSNTEAQKIDEAVAPDTVVNVEKNDDVDTSAGLNAEIASLIQ